MTIKTRKSVAWLRRSIVVAATMVLFTACGGDSGRGEKVVVSGTTGESTTGGSVTSKFDFTATPVQLTVNPCSLVTRAEAERVIGASVSEGLGANGRVCTYTANGNGGVVSVEAMSPDFGKLLFVALERNLFGGDQVRVDVGQGGMQVRGGGNVQFVVAGGCIDISASKGDASVDDATMLTLARTATERVEAAVNNRATSP